MFGSVFTASFEPPGGSVITVVQPLGERRISLIVFCVFVLHAWYFQAFTQTWTLDHISVSRWEAADVGIHIIKCTIDGFLANAQYTLMDESSFPEGTWIHLDVGWQVRSFVLESCWTFGSQHILVAESQSQEINVIQYTAASRIPSSVPTFNFCMFRGGLGHFFTSSLGSEDPWDNGRMDIPWFHSTGHVCLFWPCARQCFTLRIIVQQHRSESNGFLPTVSNFLQASLLIASALSVLNSFQRWNEFSTERAEAIKKLACKNLETALGRKHMLPAQHFCSRDSAQVVKFHWMSCVSLLIARIHGQ